MTDVLVPVVVALVFFQTVSLLLLRRAGQRLRALERDVEALFRRSESGNGKPRRTMWGAAEELP